MKFLEPRHNSAERLGVVGIKFQGFTRKHVFVDDLTDDMVSASDMLNFSHMFSLSVTWLQCLWKVSNMIISHFQDK